VARPASRRDPHELTAHYRAALGDIAAVVDAKFPHNTDLSFEDGRPVLRRRELGRVIRTITLLRFLADAQLREQITAITNKAEAFHGFSAWLRFGGEAIGRNDPDYQEKIVKFNELLANCVIYSNACDLTAAANALAADGHPIDPDDLATVSPYITHTIRRFGDWVLDLSPPETAPTTTLDLVPGALFPGSPVATMPGPASPTTVTLTPAAAMATRSQRGSQRKRF
jgi:hypothetical protein